MKSQDKSLQLIFEETITLLTNTIFNTITRITRSILFMHSMLLKHHIYIYPSVIRRGPLSLRPLLGHSSVPEIYISVVSDEQKTCYTIVNCHFDSYILSLSDRGELPYWYCGHTRWWVYGITVNPLHFCTTMLCANDPDLKKLCCASYAPWRHQILWSVHTKGGGSFCVVYPINLFLIAKSDEYYQKRYYLHLQHSRTACIVVSLVTETSPPAWS